MLAIGIVLLGIGAFLSFGSKPPQANAGMAMQCRERLKDQGAEMLARCDEAAFATAMTATDANQAAAAISASNNQEVGGNAAGMFLLGLGLIVTLAGGVAWAKRSRRPSV